MKKTILFILLFSQACLSAQTIEPAPIDKAVVYFVRSDVGAYNVQFALFDDELLISLIACRNYVRYECNPGEHLFWAKSENVDYVSADLQAGKIYLFQVIPDLGFASARVNLYPIDSLSGRTDRMKKLMDKKDAYVMDEKKRKRLQNQLANTIERCLKKATKKEASLLTHSGFFIDPENF